MAAELPESNWKEMLLWLLGRRRSFRVVGRSMAPALLEGAVVMVNPRAYQKNPPRTGQIVLARHPYRGDILLVKRVAALLDDGRCVLHSDNRREGTDSRTFGPVSLEQILGQVTSRLR